MLGIVAEPIAPFEQMRIFVYDGHDTQAVNVLSWLKPANVPIPSMTDFAIQISFELFSSATCLEGSSPS